MNEVVVVLGFFALMALLVSRMLRDRAMRKNQTPQLKVEEQARDTVMRHAAAAGNGDT